MCWANIILEKNAHDLNINKFFGCFFAYETRNVQISALNDSKYISLFIKERNDFNVISIYTLELLERIYIQEYFIKNM